VTAKRFCSQNAERHGGEKPFRVSPLWGASRSERSEHQRVNAGKASDSGCSTTVVHALGVGVIRVRLPASRNAKRFNWDAKHPE
jgi:hypothetical protein